MALDENFALANQRATNLQETVPRAVAACYDRKTGRVVIQLSSKLTISFSPHDAQGLERAKPSELDEIEISPWDSVSIFPSWAPMYTCPDCLRASLAQGSGWPRGLAGPVVGPGVRLKEQPPGPTERGAVAPRKHWRVDATPESCLLHIESICY